MPTSDKEERAAEAREMEEHLDPMEISRLHQMADAAKIMDAYDKEEKDGD